MGEPRIFVDRASFAAEVPTLVGDDHRYVTRSLRLTLGDGMVLLDGEGAVRRATITSINKQEVQLVAEPAVQVSGSNTELVACLCLIKKDRMNWAIEKVVEAGVTQIMLLASDFMPVTAGAKDGEQLVARLSGIARAAAAQCRRATLPTIHAPRPLTEWLKSTTADGLPIVVGDPEGARPIDFAEGAKASAMRFLIGPEGGFSTEESSVLASLDVRRMRLSSQVLRAETAAVVMAATLAELMDHQPGIV